MLNIFKNKKKVLELEKDIEVLKAKKDIIDKLYIETRDRLERLEEENKLLKEEVEERKAREIIYQKKLANKVKKELKESDKVRKWLYGYPNEKFGG